MTVVAPLSAIPLGEGRTFLVCGKRIAVFHTRAGEVFATQADCPHKGGPLADGLLGGTTLVCPLHSWKWDIASGEPQMASCPLETYPVHLDSENRVVLTVRTE
jgi:nitrite reductase (NADH) small subunit